MRLRPGKPAQAEVEWLPAAAADDSALVSELTSLINEVYAVAEDGLWVDDAARTSVAEMTELVRAGQFAVARAGEKVVGCVRIQFLDDRVGEFGMLAVEPGRRGTGLGRELVRFAELAAGEAGRDTMQLELLVPREWTHPSKQFLATWYGRIGYAPTRTGAIEESYPHLAPLLATACDFVIYRKDLAVS
ncbi:MAG TPA: GNAT family N-acetyltransferase [Streptosporangiaceae bacterium]|nr:GNAT family N-acetyltransferase [Streptosporangiaceae bacterium]